MKNMQFYKLVQARFEELMQGTRDNSELVKVATFKLAEETIAIEQGVDLDLLID